MEAQVPNIVREIRDARQSDLSPDENLEDILEAIDSHFAQDELERHFVFKGKQYVLTRNIPSDILKDNAVYDSFGKYSFFTRINYFFKKYF